MAALFKAVKTVRCGNLLREKGSSDALIQTSKRLVAKMQSTVVKMEFETLKLTQHGDNVLNVELNRPKKLNAMNKQFFKDMTSCFSHIAQDTEIRAVILSGSGKVFTAGLDLMEFAASFMEFTGEGDGARKAWKIKQMITEMQNSFNVIEKCPQPVIAAVHSACVGGGVDMIAACDVRLCSSDAWIQIKEVDIGLAADLGTLQRLPRLTGNHSLLRELCYTARKLHSDEAKSFGFFSHVYPDQESLMENALSMATQIAENSPVAITGTKEQLNYARDHSLEDGLNHVTTWNMSMLQTEDVMKAAQASMSKTKGDFSKL